jgi:hypothetical protein
MKVIDIITEKQLTVVKNDLKATTLVDPATKIQTIIPKDPTKPGMISKDPATNSFKLNTQDPGEVDQTIKPGDPVELDDPGMIEKAVSRKQQRFMGMVHAAQQGETPASGEVAKVARSMKKKDAKDFASTSHKGLPEEI